VAGAKLSVANSIRPDRLSHQAGSDGGKTNSSPGRARHKPSNHCAGNAGVFRLYLYARVRISLRTLHTRPRVQRAPGIPCSLSLGGNVHANLGRNASRERENCINVIASEAKQSTAPQKGRMDCFASLAMTWRQPRHALSAHSEEAAKAVSKGPNATTAENS